MTIEVPLRPHPTGNAAGSTVYSLFPLRTDATGPLRRVALVGTFTPRKCGIATFTNDVFEKLGQFYPGIEIDVYALDDPQNPLTYENVAGVIAANDPAAYAEAARAINASGVDAVWLQHEYGIFGGPDGEMVCDFANRLAAPLILTPHTVLTDPSERQRRILEHLICRATRIMVMSRHSRSILIERYAVPLEILEIVPHGAPDRPFGRAAQFKEKLGLAGKNVLMTFGLLGPGKGLERMIEAMPAIVERHPDTVYRIVGATHPNLVAHEGEAYRERLQALAETLGVADHVLWENRFLETEELLDQLEACDIYVTPYFNLQQSTSGTLSYAVALGKAVVSTPYVHARELLANDTGVLIEPDSAPALAAAVNRLLDDRDELEALQLRAYARGRQTIWPRFADGAAAVIEASVAVPGEPAPVATAPSLAAVTAMTDGTGMFQHAIDVVPDRRHGYCLDDNVRALMLMNQAQGISDGERMQRSLVFASFIQHAWNPDLRRFRNFMRFERTWAEDRGSDDSNGRALWALGQTAAGAPDRALRDWALRWYQTALPMASEFDSPRATAFAMLGSAAVLRAEPGHRPSRDFLEQGADFLFRLLGGARRPDWAWFEAVLGYDNPRLPQALIEAGQVLQRMDRTAAGLETLEWIVTQQLSAQGHFRPVGSESFGREYAHLPFDQQPLEAHAAIDAARAAYAATGNERWRAHARTAWSWFFGANDRGAIVADLATGRCQDGINPRGVNRNCGAESILAFQLSYYSMLALNGTLGVDSAEVAGGDKRGIRRTVGEQPAAYP